MSISSKGWVAPLSGGGHTGSGERQFVSMALAKGKASMWVGTEQRLKLSDCLKADSKGLCV
jgi:hypothetical protein